MTWEEAIKVCTREKECVQSALDACADGGHYVSPDGIITAFDYVEALSMAISALRERDILFEQVRGYCHTCNKNKTDFDCHAKCYGHQRGSAWEWDGGRRLEEV